MKNHSSKDIYDAYKNDHATTTVKDKKMIFTLLARITQLEKKIEALEKRS